MDDNFVRSQMALDHHLGRPVGLSWRDTTQQDDEILNRIKILAQEHLPNNCGWKHREVRQISKEKKKRDTNRSERTEQVGLCSAYRGLVTYK